MFPFPLIGLESKMRSIHAAQPNDWQKEAREHTAAIAELHCMVSLESSRG